jgi:hypothetical protein
MSKFKIFTLLNVDMNVNQDFLDNLGFKGGWNVETINNKTFYTITNPTYCQIFWLRYWYEIGYRDFGNQNFITQLKDGILTHKVILDPNNGNLLQTPLGWSLISYLGGTEFLTDGIVQAPFSGTFVLIAFFILIISTLIVAYWRGRQ